jgi:hypothetical protein
MHSFAVEALELEYRYEEISALPGLTLRLAPDLPGLCRALAEARGPALGRLG